MIQGELENLFFFFFKFEIRISEVKFVVCSWTTPGFAQGIHCLDQEVLGFLTLTPIGKECTPAH